MGDRYLEKIIITPEMAAAGYAAVQENGPYPDTPCTEDWLERAFIAMRLVEILKENKPAQQQKR